VALTALVVPFLLAERLFDPARGASCSRTGSSSLELLGPTTASMSKRCVLFTALSAPTGGS
jgi:hypothetical protein